MNVMVADLGERHRTFPKSVQPGIPKLGELKPGWKRVEIGDLFKVVTRPCQLVDTETYSLVTVKRARGGIEARGDLLGSEIAVKSQFFIQEDDFLISKRQIVHGACAVVPASFSGSIVSNEYAVLRCKSALDLGFLRQLIHSNYFQETCFHSSLGVHVEKMIFSTPEWFSWKIDIPEIDEQKRIAGFLGAVDRRVPVYQYPLPPTPTMQPATPSSWHPRPSTTHPAPAAHIWCYHCPLRGGEAFRETASSL